MSRTIHATPREREQWFINAGLWEVCQLLRKVILIALRGMQINIMWTHDIWYHPRQHWLQVKKNLKWKPTSNCCLGMLLYFIQTCDRVWYSSTVMILQLQIIWAGMLPSGHITASTLHIAATHNCLKIQVMQSNWTIANQQAIFDETPLASTCYPQHMTISSPKDFSLQQNSQALQARLTDAGCQKRMASAERTWSYCSMLETRIPHEHQPMQFNEIAYVSNDEQYMKWIQSINVHTHYKSI